MTDRRPDPDVLLAHVEREQEKAARGKLTIFFGATAGVGKTYSMLETAHARRNQGVDVVVGYIEPHGRNETDALLEGLEQLPFREIEYRGRRLREFDLDAALARKPRLLLVDELAHSNPIDGTPSPRHAKRWQDVEELCAAGIDVLTTVNVQHVESLNDVVAGITGVRMQETVPDAVFEQADEVVLIDTPPDELLDRLRAGKVYVPEQARQAIDNFFRKGNLIALRELALRTTAERVDRAMEEYRAGHGIDATWAAGERLLVAIGPDEQGERLVRAGKRMAIALHADWIAVYVETPDLLRLSDEKRNERIAVLRLAESLGAESVTLSGRSPGEALTDYARQRNVTRILIGRPRRPLWRRLFRASTYGELIAGSEGIDLHVVGGADDAAVMRSAFFTRSRTYLAATEGSNKLRWPGYIWGMLATALCTLAGLWISPLFELTNLAMVYLLAVVLVAVRHGRGPGVLASVLAVASFDFFFVPPFLTFAVSDLQYVLTFVIMLAVALIISGLTASVRLQANVSGHRERRTALLYAMSRELAATRGEESMARVAVRHVSEVFDSQVVVLLPDAAGRLHHPRGAVVNGSLRSADLSVAQWVQDRGLPAGLGTDTLPAAGALFLPLKGSESVLGVMGVLPANPRRVLLPEQFHLLETFAGQIALALERARLADQAQQASIDAETENLRNALLASISHDLRSPLAAIVGASSGLVEDAERLQPEERTELARTIYDEAQRMATLANNILDMARLDSGSVRLNYDWYPLDEVVGSVLTRLEPRLRGREVRLHLPRDLGLVRLDAVLIGQVFVNLIENALKYTAAGTPIEIAAAATGATVTLTVADHGPGIPAGSEERLFEKFFRGSAERAQSGVGLGLTICRAIVEAHGGTISAANRNGGGAEFSFTLPRGNPPGIEPEDAAEDAA